MKYDRNNLRRVVVFEDDSHKDVKYWGLFHEWTLYSDECDGGSLHYPCGIIEEVRTGKVHAVFVEHFRFENRTDKELSDEGELGCWR
jgi:hypothetical protein